MTCNKCNGTGMAYRWEDKDPYEGYKLADKKPCLKCNGVSEEFKEKENAGMTNYNDGKWHGWNGGECPVDERSQVQIVWQFKDGDIRQGNVCGAALEFIWEGNNSGDIVAFRVIKEHKVPREFWLFYRIGDDEWAVSNDEKYARESHQNKYYPVMKVREVLE